MKLVADQNIPLVEELFAPHFSIARYPSSAITGDVIQDASVLLCRSTLKINRELLHNSAIQCVATTTSGHDHIDTEYCENNDITWFHAPGCNAVSVADYVISTIAALRQRRLLTDFGKAAVIGVGNVGSIVAKRLEKLGFTVLKNDPLRQQNEPDFTSCHLEDIQGCDFICCHTPLTHTGEFPSYHLIDQKFLQRQKPGCIILNAGRGAVFNTQDCLDYGKHLIFCLDVFENEPDIHPAIFDIAEIATPHIAGHRIQGKWRGTEMAYDQIAKLFCLPPRPSFNYPIDKPKLIIQQHNPSWEDIVLAVYDPRDDTEQFKQARQQLSVAEAFSQYRKNYPIVHELSYCEIIADKIPTTIQQLLTL